MLAAVEGKQALLVSTGPASSVGQVCGVLLDTVVLGIEEQLSGARTTAVRLVAAATAGE